MRCPKQCSLLLIAENQAKVVQIFASFAHGTRSASKNQRFITFSKPIPLVPHHDHFYASKRWPLNAVSDVRTVGGVSAL